MRPQPPSERPAEASEAGTWRIPQLGELYGAITRGRGGVSDWIGLAGAATSLTLVLGLGVWGYRLMMRDINGVPVIRALEGPMRVQPEDPGGERMAFQGLTVNEVAARGEAGEVGDAAGAGARARRAFWTTTCRGRSSPRRRCRTIRDAADEAVAAAAWTMPATAAPR